MPSMGSPPQSVHPQPGQFTDAGDLPDGGSGGTAAGGARCPRASSGWTTGSPRSG